MDLNLWYHAGGYTLIITSTRLFENLHLFYYFSKITQKVVYGDDNGPRKSLLSFGDVPGSGGTLTFNGPPKPLGFDHRATDIAF